MSRMPHKSNGAGPDPRVRFVSTTKPSKKKRKKKRAKQHPLTTGREKMLADLARSGLDASDAERLQCKPVSGRRAKELLGISKVKLPDGSIIPYFNGAGKRIKGAFRWRALGDYSQRDAKTGKREPGPKYRQTLGSKPRLHFSPLIDWRDVDGPIVITEGEKKAACACKVGIATIGLGGVWNWKVPKSDDQLLPDFAEVLEDGADVVLCFDTDSETNSNVRLALARLAAALEKAGYGVSVVYLPSGKDGEKAGLDDFLVAAGRKDNGKLGLAGARRVFEKLPRNDPPPIDPIRIISAADVKPEPVRPVWLDVLYLRKVTLVAGEPGLGKSLLTCDVTARVSSEADWPGGGSSVIMISGEDDAEDTIVPRLMAAGADLSKVQIMDGVVEKRDGELSALSLDKHARSVHAAEGVQSKLDELQTLYDRSMAKITQIHRNKGLTVTGKQEAFKKLKAELATELKEWAKFQNGYANQIQQIEKDMQPTRHPKDDAAHELRAREIRDVLRTLDPAELELAFARLPNLAMTNYCKRCKRKTPLMAGFSRITPKRT